MKTERDLSRIAAQLRRARQLVGLSQRELAACAGVHQPEVVRAERGDDMLVSRLIELAGSLGLEVRLVARASDSARGSASRKIGSPVSDAAPADVGATQGDAVERNFDTWAREWPMIDPEVFAVLARLSRAGRHVDQATESVARIHGMHGGEIVLLGALRRSGPPYENTPTGLKHLLWLSLPGIKKRLDRLESLGMIARIPNQSDLRGSLVRLTAKGHAALDDLVTHPQSRVFAALLELPASMRTQLSAMLRQLLARLEQEPLREDHIL